jgi:arginine decarboxylase
MDATITWMDVGGGLGVDYDGSRTDFESSMNYSLQEYANDVVWHLAEACREHDLPEPTILSESGRALVAHHALLVADVLGVSDLTPSEIPAPPTTDEAEIIAEIADVCEKVTSKNFLEAYHDMRDLRERAMILFNVGQLSLADRARVEEFYWRGCEKISRIIRRLDYVPDDLEDLERDMADTYFLNFSLFQSVPDSWAIKQLFPVMPLHRLLEQPTKRAVLADITCDSDGKIDRFIDLRDVKKTLELHAFDAEKPYFLGIFMVGAYQEILGDLHNLFGDTNIVHVDIDAQGRPKLDHVVRGDRVKDVLQYVDFVDTDLIHELRQRVEEALAEERITYEESAVIMRRFEQGLHNYTYLSREPAAVSANHLAETPT